MEFPLFFFFLGLVIGSFLNVVIFRLAEGETLLGRSACRLCHAQIAWYDNIPIVSYLVLRGRCRGCKAKISPQYPLVEALTGLGYLLVGMFFFEASVPESWLTTGWFLLLLSSLVVIFIYDLRHMEIPINLLIFGIAVTLGYLVASTFWFEGQVPPWETKLANGLLGGGIVTLFFFALVSFSKETWMGWGDVWLGMLAGLAVGGKLAFIMLTLSFALGAGIGILLMIFRQKDLSTQVPFAPFLITGLLAILFLQELKPEFLLPFQW